MAILQISLHPTTYSSLNVTAKKQHTYKWISLFLIQTEDWGLREGLRTWDPRTEDSLLPYESSKVLTNCKLCSFKQVVPPWSHIWNSLLLKDFCLQIYLVAQKLEAQTSNDEFGILHFCIWTSEGQLRGGMFDSCRNPNKHFPSISLSANTIKNLTDILQLKIRAATFPLIIPFINVLRLSLPNLEMRLKWHDDHILQKIIKTPDEKRYQLIITILVLFLPRWNLRYHGPFFIGVVLIYRTKSIRYEKKTLELRTRTVKRGINSTTPRLTEEL